jgi:hypothetical protein
MTKVGNIPQSTLNKAKLERMCTLYLRQMPRFDEVEWVTVAASPNPARNWYVVEIEPSLPLVNDLAARGALGELQREFRLNP